MSRRSSMLVCVLFALIAIAVGCGSGDEDAAVDAAAQWLELLDSGEVAKSWEQSSDIFRKKLSSEDFAKSIEGSRGSLGKSMSRKLRTAQAAQTLPNEPRGRYVVIQFDSVFANHPAMVETVTTKFEGDDWRVLGYRMR